MVILQVRNSLIPFVRKIHFWFGDVHFLNGQFRKFDLRDLLLWLWAQRCHECRVHCKQSSLLCFHSLSHLCSQQVSQLSSFQLAINPRSNEHPFKQHPSTHFSKVILLCFAGYCSLTSEAGKSFQKWQAISIYALREECDHSKSFVVPLVCNNKTFLFRVGKSSKSPIQQRHGDIPGTESGLRTFHVPKHFSKSRRISRVAPHRCCHMSHVVDPTKNGPS